MSRPRLDLAVLQRNVIILRQMRGALDNAPFQMIAAVLRQQLRKIGGKLRLVILDVYKRQLLRSMRQLLRR